MVPIPVPQHSVRCELGIGSPFFNRCVRTMRDGRSVQQKLTGSDGERAVSPVIGVILMVAITVIFAATTAMFVTGVGDDQNSPAQVGYQIENNTDDTDLQVTIISMGGNTKTVKCMENGVKQNTTSSVDGTMTCPTGSTIIGINEQDEENVIERKISD